MSDTWLVTIGVIVGVGLLLIPIVMIGRVVFAVISESRQARAAEARRVTRTIPGLGEFWTTDNELWLGNADGLEIAIYSHGPMPAESQIELVRAVLRQLRHFVEKSVAYLLSHEENAWFKDDAAGFQPYAIDSEDVSRFVLELTHAADIDGVYRVTFCDGEPVDFGRDD